MGIVEEFEKTISQLISEKERESVCNVTYILKAKKFAESAFQSQKKLRKECVNLDVKISRQKCVNQ